MFQSSTDEKCATETLMEMRAQLCSACDSASIWLNAGQKEYIIHEQYSVEAHPALFKGKELVKNEVLLFQSTVDKHFQNAHKTLFQSTVDTHIQNAHQIYKLRWLALCAFI